MHETLNGPNTESVWRKPLQRAADSYLRLNSQTVSPRGLYESQVYGRQSWSRPD